LPLNLILQNFMHIFNVGLFFQATTFQIFILIEKQKVKKVKKQITVPTLRENPPPLGVVSSHAGIKVKVKDRKYPQKTFMSTQKEVYNRKTADFP